MHSCLDTWSWQERLVKTVHMFQSMAKCVDHNVNYLHLHANTLIFKSTTANQSSINQEVIHCHTKATSSPKPHMHVSRGTWS